MAPDFHNGGETARERERARESEREREKDQRKRESTPLYKIPVG